MLVGTLALLGAAVQFLGVSVYIGYVMEDYWCDVGSLNQYRQAQYTVLDGRTKVKLTGHE